MNANDLDWNIKTLMGQRLLDQKTLGVIPRNEQEGKISDRKVYLHLFLGAFDWFITDVVDLDEGLVFGWVNNGYDPMCSEWGYISLAELAKLKVRNQCVIRNEQFTTKRASEIECIDCLGD